MRNDKECQDEWQGRDKKLHIAACAILAVIWPPIAIVAAIAKEAYDARKEGNHWCWKDLVADAVGIIAGTILRVLLF